MSVYVELEVSGRIALSRVIEGWSEAEKRALFDADDEGHEDAVAAVFDLVAEHILRSPDDVDVLTREMTLWKKGDPPGTGKRVS